MTLSFFITLPKIAFWKTIVSLNDMWSLERLFMIRVKVDITVAKATIKARFLLPSKKVKKFPKN
jgi:hypothetical protein